VTALESDPSVPAWAEVPVAPIAGEPAEGPWQRQPVSFRDPPGQADVLPRLFVRTVPRGRSGEGLETLDALARDAHCLPVWSAELSVFGNPLVNRTVLRVRPERVGERRSER
jgi:hypothetical protein